MRGGGFRCVCGLNFMRVKVMDDAVLSVPDYVEQLNGLVLAADDILWLDLELDPKSGRLLEGAWLVGGKVWRFDGQQFEQQRQLAAQYLARAAALGGHNLVEFDLPALDKLLHGSGGNAEILAAWREKAVDTLYWTTLLMPHQPRYALAKLYRADTGHNNPVQDCVESRALWQSCCSSWQGLPEGLQALFVRLLPVVRWFPEAAGLPFDERQLYEQLPAAGNRGDLCARVAAAVAETPSWRHFALAVLVHWLRHFERPQARRPVWLNKHPQHGARFREAEEAFFRWGEWDEASLNQACREIFSGLADFQGLRAGQLSIAQGILANRDMPLGILPTGGGKSLAFQLPALLLSKYRRGLTVVVSPLKALIIDQVDNLRANAGIYAERVAGLVSGQTETVQRDILEGVWRGSIDVLYLSPERLRSRSIRVLLKNRPPALWVLDEAHTLSQWGTDFRPDFLRIAEHIAACYDPPDPSAADGLFDDDNRAVPAVGLVTATASARVKDDLQRELTDKLAKLTRHSRLQQYGTPLEELTVQRSNIERVFQNIPPAQRDSRVLQILQQRRAEYAAARADAQAGVALVYIRHRKHCEDFAKLCQSQGLAAVAYHAGLPENQRSEIIEQFKDNRFEVVVCTNAFGMGIDKAGVHTVIHYAPPANLESYIQESGRAARKSGEHGRAYLLWSQSDIEQLFRLERENRIHNSKTLHDCWHIIRPILKRPANDQWFADTDLAGVLQQENDMLLTQIRVALLALERYGLLVEKEQQPARIGLKLLPEHAATDLPAPVAAVYRQLQQILAGQDWEREFVQFHLPELSLALGQPVKKLLSALHTLVQSGYAQWRVELGIRLRYKNHFLKQQMARYQKYLTALREVFARYAWQPHGEDDVLLCLDVLNHALAQHSTVKTDARKDILPLLSALGAIRYRSINAHEVSVLPTEAAAAAGAHWQGWLEVAEHCLVELAQLLDYLMQHADADSPRVFVLSGLADTLAQSPEAVLQRLEILQKLALIDLTRTDGNDGSLFFIGASATQRKNYHENAYQYLKTHYQERCQRLHLLYRWLQYGDEHDPVNQNLSAADCRRLQHQLLEDYFKKNLATVVHEHCPDPEAAKQPRLKNYDRAILPDHFSSTQKAIVCEAGRAALVLAGPGAGKTAVVVHRVAYLLMKQDILPEKILILAYNRLAVAELRRRLYALIGDYARGVTVSTFHGLARHITQADENDAPAAEVERLLQQYPHLDGKTENARYQWLLEQAVARLKNQENRLFYQYIMVDEFQDIDAVQYDLIAQLANLQEQEDGESLYEQQGYLMAVGDDDQNLYAFRGASIRYIQQFADNYHIGGQQQYFLTTNYRSCPNIVDLANAYIQTALPAAERLKSARHAITAHRTDNAAPVRYGLFAQVRGIDMAAWLAQDIHKLRQLHPQHSIAVLARRWRDFDAVQHYLEQQGIRCQCRNQSETQHPLHSMVGRALLAHLGGLAHQLIEGKAVDYLKQWRKEQGFNQLDKAWPALLHSVLNLRDVSGQTLIDALEQAVYDRQNPVVLLTYHSAKGMEFDAVYIIDEQSDFQANQDTVRQMYVALTRAKSRLTVLQHRYRCDKILHVLLQQMGEVFDIGAVSVPSKLYFHRFLALDEIQLTPADLVRDEGRIFLAHCCQGDTHPFGDSGEWSVPMEFKYENRFYDKKSGQGYQLEKKRYQGFMFKKDNQNYMLAYFSNKFADDIREQQAVLNMLGFTTLYFVQNDRKWYRESGYFGTETAHFVLVPYVRFEVSL